MELSQKDRDSFDRAHDYATKMHSGQIRIGGAPYISHPIAVAEMLKHNSFPLEYQITGLFHDLLEDTTASVEEIILLGGENVAAAVKLLTKEPGYQMDAYIRRIKRNAIAKAVKSADRLHNLQCAVMADEQFKKKYIDETIGWYMDFSSPMFDIKRAVEALTETMEAPK